MYVLNIRHHYSSDGEVRLCWRTDYQEGSSFPHVEKVLKMRTVTVYDLQFSVRSKEFFCSTAQKRDCLAPFATRPSVFIIGSRSFLIDNSAFDRNNIILVLQSSSFKCRLIETIFFSHNDENDSLPFDLLGGFARRFYRSLPNTITDFIYV